jgi:hypothetical protein
VRERVSAPVRLSAGVAAALALELALELKPVERERFAWTVSAQYAREHRELRDP